MSLTYPVKVSLRHFAKYFQAVRFLVHPAKSKTANSTSSPSLRCSSCPARATAIGADATRPAGDGAAGREPPRSPDRVAPPFIARTLYDGSEKLHNAVRADEVGVSV